MKQRIKSGIILIISSLLIAISYNLFVLPNKLIAPGINGLGAIIKYTTYFSPAIFILIVNLCLLLIAISTFGFEKSYKYITSCVLIPLFIYLTQNITSIIKLENLEMVLIVICASLLIGFGNSLIYKEGYSVGGFYIFEDIINSMAKKQRKYLSLICDIIIVLISFTIIPLENAIYSLFLVVIAKRLTTIAKLGINDSKAFYIITSKEKEVKKYIMEDLKHDITILEAKGGFTKKQNNILMTVISSKEYYELKEGIKEIDPNAFISITDSYEVLNKNVKINKEKGK